MKLTDSRRGFGKKHCVYAAGDCCRGFAGRDTARREVRGDQRGRASGVSADARTSQPKRVREAANHVRRSVADERLRRQAAAAADNQVEVFVIHATDVDTCTVHLISAPLAMLGDEGYMKHELILQSLRDLV